MPQILYQKKEAKLKTGGVAEFLEPLLEQLNQLTLTPNYADPSMKTTIDEIQIHVETLKEHLEDREKLEKPLIGYLEKITREINYWIKNNEENKYLVSSSIIGKRITDDFRALRQKLALLEIVPSYNARPHKKASNVPLTSTQLEFGESSNNSNQEEDGSIELEECMKELQPHLKDCLHSLAIFPENKELKKRLLVYWWIGLGIVWQGNDDKTCEQFGEEYFSELVKKGVLIPVLRKHNKMVDRCTINPKIHRQLIASCGRDGNEICSNKKVEEEDGTWHFYEYGTGGSKVKALLNLDINYLNSSNINSKMKEMQVQILQLGTWQNPKSDQENAGSSKDHIEVNETNFLIDMPQSVRYLSLRGISGVTKLPKSVGKLGNLRILDLRSCHNLECLPEKPRSKLRKMIAPVLPEPQSKWFDNLTHLDISECHLLNSLPKWICQLSNLEVLKGFVVGSLGTKTQVARLRDLSKLKKLRKLNIKVANKHFSPADFCDLELMSNLLVLTIIWSINDRSRENTRESLNITNVGSKDSYISFPKNLDKLDLRCYPNAKAPELSKSANSDHLKKLKRLYIRGGNLTNIRDDAEWEEVEILRLRFLKNFDFDWYQLNTTFPKLKCVEYEKCPRLRNFPRNRSSWIMEQDGPFPNLHGLFDDDEEVVLPPNSEVSRPVSDRSRRIELEIDDKRIAAPLAESTCDVFVKLRHYNFWEDRDGLDLVVVLDISRSMKGDKLAEIKVGLLHLISELEQKDRLSIVTFDTIAKRQCGLFRITESFKTELKDLINSFEANGDGDTNTFDGLQIGLKVLKDRRLSSKRDIGIMLVSGGAQTIRFGDAAKVPLGNVPVHTFGFGNSQDSKVLEAIADNSIRGRFTDLQIWSNCREPLQRSLYEFLGTETNGVTLTITPIVEGTRIGDVCWRRAVLPKRTNDRGSVIVEVGSIYKQYSKLISFNLFLPRTDKELRTATLQVSYSYECIGMEEKFESEPVTIYVDRKRTVIRR